MKREPKFWINWLSDRFGQMAHGSIEIEHDLDCWTARVRYRGWVAQRTRYTNEQSARRAAIAMARRLGAR